MVAFETPFMALKWCLMTQEELLRADWPIPILQYKYSMSELDSHGNIILFTNR